MRSKLISVLLVMLLVFGLGTAAFANGETEGESDGAMPKVGFLPGDMANESQAFSAKMFKKYGADYGFDVVILDGKGDAQVQAQVVTNAIAQNLKAIFVNPNDVNAIIPSLIQAKKAGLIVGMFSSDVPKESASARDFFVGVNDNMAGESAAEAFIQAFPNGAKIVEIGGQAGHDAQIKRHDGFNKKIAGTPIEVIDYKATQQWATDQAMAIMEDMITKYGDTIDGVFCHWDNGATGVISAAEAAGMKDVFIVGVDGNRAGFDQVREGKQSVTIMQNFENMAKKTLGFARSIMDGQKVDKVNFVPLEIVDLGNIDDFTAPEW